MPAIIQRKVSIIGTIQSCTFRDNRDTVECAGLCASIVLDFFMKSIGGSHVKQNKLKSFPLGISEQYKPALFSRTLLLNCLTKYYADLWQECWREDYRQEQWSIADDRLKPFAGLTEQWNWDTPLRNYFERRQALVEIDVISAMALGLSLEDLEMIYTIQFPVLQQNEDDTWYDAHGNIVFTCSKGLTGVGLERKGSRTTTGWEDIRGEEIRDADGRIIGYQGTAPTYVHTIDPKKSELYGGKQVTYYAPYTRPDRLADYRRAWSFFEKRF